MNPVNKHINNRIFKKQYEETSYKVFKVLPKQYHSLRIKTTPKLIKQASRRLIYQQIKELYKK